jgi:hypothetical protein
MGGWVGRNVVPPYEITHSQNRVSSSAKENMMIVFAVAIAPSCGQFASFLSTFIAGGGVSQTQHDDVTNT